MRIRTSRLRTRIVSHHASCFLKARITKEEESRSLDRKSTRLNSSHSQISYAVFCLKKKKHASSTLPSHTQPDSPSVLPLPRLAHSVTPACTVARRIAPPALTRARLSSARLEPVHPS